MKKSTIISLILVTIACLLLTVVFILLKRERSGTTSGWGDNGGGRTSYTIKEIDEGVLGNKIVFNSISNSTIGNEKNFVCACEYQSSNAEGIENIWQANEIEVTDGQEYIIRAYVHNNSPWNYNVAINTHIAFNIPTDSATIIPVHGFIFADNASPSEYWDGVLFQSDKPFHLEYIYGSALIENGGYASQENGGAKPLSDEIVTKAASNHGVEIGFDQEGDGQIPGGCECYVSIRVKAVFDADYRIEQRVRLAGTTEWRTNVDAKIGDKLEFRIQYKNTSDSTHRNVMIRDILPDNLAYQPCSTILTNAAYTLNIDQDDLFTTGINIGHYAAGANALIDFTVEVVDNSLQDGSNNLVNWSQGGVGQKTIQDYSTVTVYKDRN